MLETFSAKSLLRNIPLLSVSPSLSLAYGLILSSVFHLPVYLPLLTKKRFSQILLVLTSSKSFHLPLTMSACHLLAPNYSGGLHTQSEHFLPNFPGSKIKCGLKARLV